ncbi:Cyanocobalamin reductase (cyanide-eliminating) [Balamuthia mandrillaris]
MCHDERTSTAPSSPMTATESEDAFAFVKQLQTRLKDRGFDICSPFRVSDYNAKAKRHPLPDFEVPDALGLVIGCTKTFWPEFIDWLFAQYQQQNPEEDDESCRTTSREDEKEEQQQQQVNTTAGTGPRQRVVVPTLRRGTVIKDPVDTWCKTAVEGVLAEEPFGSRRYDLRFDWHGPRGGKYVHIQTAGHVTGHFPYDQDTMWCCHPEYGVWFVFRCVVVFDLPFPSHLPEPPKLLFSIMPEAAKEEIKQWTAVACKEGWRNAATLLRIRDACPIGKERWRYDGDVLAYFYPVEESKSDVLWRVLCAVAKEKGLSGATAEEQALEEENKKKKMERSEKAEILTT